MSDIFEPAEHLRDVPKEASLAFIGGTYIKQFDLKARTTVGSHKHSYDHASILASGEVIVETDEGVARYAAPAVLTIKAGLMHRVYAVKDSVWFCVHSVDAASEAYKNQDPHSMDGMLFLKESA